MSLACFRRPRREADRPGESERALLRAVGGDLRLEGARLAAAKGGDRFWVVPTRDGEGVAFLGVGARGGGGGGGLPFETLAQNGAAASISPDGAHWRYAELVADGYEQVRIGSHRADVSDNMVVLDLPDRERLIEMRGPAGSRVLDLGPSGWDEFMAAARD